MLLYESCVVIQPECLGLMAFLAGFESNLQVEIQLPHFLVWKALAPSSLATPYHPHPQGKEKEISCSLLY